ncbi:MAG: hypothetical protein R3D98_09825 [Candidatus Krumholzibacteriia bacterium]
MRRLICVASCLATVLALAVPASAQSYWVRHSSFYVEVMGSGGVASVNFEQLVTEKVAMRVGLGGGLGWFEEQVVAPATVSYLVGDRNSFLELGAGVAFVAVPDDANPDDLLYDDPDSHVAGTAILGYRYQGDWGLFMRLAFTPLVNSEGFVPMGGAALGYSF